MQNLIFVFQFVINDALYKPPRMTKSVKILKPKQISGLGKKRYKQETKIMAFQTSVKASYLIFLIFFYIANEDSCYSVPYSSYSSY